MAHFEYVYCWFFMYVWIVFLQTESSPVMHHYFYFFFPPHLQNGYIDGPVLNTFRTNLVVLPAVMEYMQYSFIALGLVVLIIGILVYHKAKVKLPHSIKPGVCNC